MENASKALIIAGAILLAILLISLGIMIFTQAQDTVNTSGMSQTEIQTYNSKFLKYEGQKIKGAEAKALVSEAITSAATTGRTLTITLGGTVITGTSTILTDKTYKVELGYSNGLVNSIALTQNL